MKISELNEKLTKNGISKQAYSLNNGPLIEGYFLEKIGDSWVVYYSEKGMKIDLNVFYSEELACEFFYIYISVDDYVYNV